MSLPTRPLPNSAEAERSVLYCLMNDKRAWHLLAENGFSGDWFHLPANRTVFKAMEQMRLGGGTALSPDMVISHFVANGKVAEIGQSTIADITDSWASFGQLEFFRKQMADLFRQRETIRIATQLVQIGFEAASEFEEKSDALMAELASVQTPSRGRSLVDASEMVRRTIDALEHRRTTGSAVGVPSGITDFDIAAGGLIPDLIVIGAETSRGKSVLALMFAIAAARARKRTLIFSLEMNATVVGERLMSQVGEVEMSQLRSPHGMTENDYRKVCNASQEIANLPIHVCEDADITIHELRAIARAEHAREPLGCIIVDYVQLVSSPKTQVDTREREVALIAANLKKLAEELRVAVIAPTQLNDDGKVRESRAIAHHAAICILIDDDGLTLSKNRHGRRGEMIPYILNGAMQRFERKSIF